MINVKKEVLEKMLHGTDRSKQVESFSDIKAVIAHTEEIFKDYWRTSVSYNLNRLKEMKSKNVSIPVSLNKVLLYIKALNEEVDIGSRKNPNLNVKVLEEVRKLEQDAGYCIHMSILTKTLMDEIDAKQSKKFKYYQGYSTLITEDPFAAMLFGPKQVGIHAWLTFENAVVDVTSIQHKHSITLPNTKYGRMVVGEMPKSYLLSGFKEEDSIIKDYQEKFALDMNCNRDEWIAFHVNAFDKFNK